MKSGSSFQTIKEKLVWIEENKIYFYKKLEYFFFRGIFTDLFLCYDNIVFAFLASETVSVLNHDTFLANLPFFTALPPMMVSAGCGLLPWLFVLP